MSLKSNKSVARALQSCAPIFSALGEPARQSIVMLLVEHESLNVNELTERLPLSRPAISHHLKILRQAQLVAVEQIGTENRYSLSVEEALSKLEAFVGLVKGACEA